MEYEQDNSGHPDFGYPASSTHSSKDDASVNESNCLNVAMVTGDDLSMAKTPDKRRLESTDEIDDAVDVLADRIPQLASKPVKVDSRMARDLNNPFKRQSSVVQESQDMTGGAFDNFGEMLEYVPRTRTQSGNFKSAQPKKIFNDPALHQEPVRSACSKETENRHLIKSRLIFNELKLLIYVLFWIDDEDHTSDITHHSGSSLIKLRAKHTDTLYFTIEASSENDEYFLKRSNPIKESFKLEYFSWDTCRKFEFRVNPGPDKIRSKYIDIDFLVQAESTEPYKIFTRFNNLDKHEDPTRFQEQRQERKATEHCNCNSINPSINVHQHYSEIYVILRSADLTLEMLTMTIRALKVEQLDGDSTRTLTGRTVVENGGKYDEKAYGNTATTIKPG